MSNKTETDTDEGKFLNARRRNWILGIVLAGFALFMYVSIFVRLSINPLAYGQ